MAGYGGLNVLLQRFRGVGAAEEVVYPSGQDFFRLVGARVEVAGRVMPGCEEPPPNFPNKEPNSNS